MNTVSIICIGDELLIGDIQDTNGHYLSKSLSQIGYQIQARYTINDDYDNIISTIDQAHKNAEFVIITGGLGPTKDDITKKAILDYCHLESYRNDTILQHIQHILQSKNKIVDEANLTQADIPEGATVLFNRLGTAPGLWISFQNKTIIVMPGVPFEMQTITQEELLPRLKEKMINDIPYHSYIMTAGISEVAISKKISDIVDNMPHHIHLAYLPSYGTVQIRLTATQQAFSEIEIYKNLIAERINEYIYSFKLQSLAEATIQLLIQQRLTVSTAESCTGGNIGSCLTNISGSSATYLGGIIAYDYLVKSNILKVSEETLQTFGAVSHECVIEMAIGCLNLIKSDIAISISGILGPKGATETKPVGRIYVGIAAKGKTISYEFNYRYDRLINKEYITQSVLFLIYKTAKNWYE